MTMHTTYFVVNKRYYLIQELILKHEHVEALKLSIVTFCQNMFIW